MNITEKPLYAVDLTADQENDRPDETPFQTVILSDELRKRREAASDELHKHIFKGLGLSTLLVAIVCIGVGAMALVSFAVQLLGNLTSEGPDAVFTERWVLLVIGIVLLAVGLLLFFVNKKRDRNEDEDSAYEEAESALERINQSVAFELGLPEEEQMTQIDVLSFRYRRTGNAIKEVREETVYDTVCASFWRQGDALYMTDDTVVFRIPLSDIIACSLTDEPYKVGLWWKDDEPGEGAYANCDIVEDDDLNYCGLGIGEVRVRCGEDVYLLRIPGYDFGALRELIGL